MKKVELRKLFRNKREQLSQMQIQEWSHKILEQFKIHFSFQGKNISIFLPIKEQNEIDTTQLLEFLHSNNTIVVSKSSFKIKTMELFRYENEEQLSISFYGIPEPQYGERIDANDLDVIIVPLLCFDKNGYRVGYGKGFYDRLIKDTKSDCILIGLSFFEPVDVINDINDFDEKINYCITPDKVYKFDDH